MSVDEKELKAIVDHQANLEGLWMLKPTIIEAILMAALRHLHAVIEGDRVTAKKAKAVYWNLEDDDDPTPWCAQCGAKFHDECKCGPIAENN